MNTSTPQQCAQKIRKIFEERFTRFEDRWSSGSTIEEVKPLVTNYFVLDSRDPFGPCEKQSAHHGGEYLNGATLGYAIELVSREVDFTEESVARAEQIKGLFLASPMFVDVKHYLLMLPGAPDKESIEAKSKGFHERYIREMAIEFNQVGQADDYVKSLGESSMEEIVEEIKSSYYSSWKNEKDYEWIASLMDFTDEYVMKEYEKLSLAAFEIKTV